MFKYFKTRLIEYNFIILAATIFLLSFPLKSFSNENVFVVDNIQVEGKIDINFSREKYINKAFILSFDNLMSKILLKKDSSKLANITLNEIKTLIESFQIVAESHKQNFYKGTFKIFYSDKKVKKFLVKRNISFSKPNKITAIFFPILFVNNKPLNFNENYFYQNWNKIESKNESINFLLPIEDIDDIEKIKKIKDEDVDFEFKDFIKKYNTTNYVVIIMDYRNKFLNSYIKTNFNNNKFSKNISFKISNLNDEDKLREILNEMRMEIKDIWKKENIINLAIPLTIKVKFNYKKLEELDLLSNVFYKISTIDQFSLEEFNTNNSYFKIYYFGNPRKLSNELFKFGYSLQNSQGIWEIAENE